ncbi:hypothetical protein PYW07_013246 [Mythimna separata]|uniref:Uncharacterized protein n=1 Tax=Mythimna separata TaxID=271217 RepID=A0AAD7Y5X6_MYTSE|nr:hypothetical protein PYW07_013246 [Mythimna separata]
MSDISGYSINSNGSNSHKRRISQIDETIEHLTQEVNSLNNFVFKSEFEYSLMTVRMKREKLKALSAIARAQVIMADMQVRVAEGELYTDVEKLKNLKKLRLDNEDAVQRHICQMPARPSTATVSVQTTRSKIGKKYTRHSSSRKSPVHNSAPVDNMSEETVFIPSIYENALHTEISQGSPNLFSQGLFEKTPGKRSGSEVSLSSSVKAEFNDPFTQTELKETTRSSPAKKHKSDKKGDSKKSKSQSNSQKANSVSASKQSQSAPKTVVDLRKTADKKSLASATFVPARHTNLPEIVSRPSTSTMPPVFSVNSAQSDLYQNPQDPRPYRLLPFYGTQ